MKFLKFEKKLVDKTNKVLRANLFSGTFHADKGAIGVEETGKVSARTRSMSWAVFQCSSLTPARASVAACAEPGVSSWANARGRSRRAGRRSLAWETRRPLPLKLRQTRARAAVCSRARAADTSRSRRRPRRRCACRAPDTVRGTPSAGSLCRAGCADRERTRMEALQGRRRRQLEARRGGTPVRSPSRVRHAWDLCRSEWRGRGVRASEALRRWRATWSFARMPHLNESGVGENYCVKWGAAIHVRLGIAQEFAKQIVHSGSQWAIGDYFEELWCVED